MNFASLCLPNSDAVRRLTTFLLIALLLLALVGPAFAGTTGTEFQDIYTKVREWITGYLGRAIALMAFLVGLFYGAIKQNFIIALGGVGIAIMIAVIPNVMDQLVSAVI